MCSIVTEMQRTKIKLKLPRYLSDTDQREDEQTKYESGLQLNQQNEWSDQFSQV